MTSSEGFQQHYSIKSKFVCCAFLHEKECSFYNMALPVMEFQVQDTKLEFFLHKNQHTQRKLLNFENWTNREPQ
jgi:hypothetical protein